MEAIVNSPHNAMSRFIFRIPGRERKLRGGTIGDGPLARQDQPARGLVLTTRRKDRIPSFRQNGRGAKGATGWMRSLTFHPPASNPQTTRVGFPVDSS